MPLEDEVLTDRLDVDRSVGLPGQAVIRVLVWSAAHKLGSCVPIASH